MQLFDRFYSIKVLQNEHLRFKTEIVEVVVEFACASRFEERSNVRTLCKRVLQAGLPGPPEIVSFWKQMSAHNDQIMLSRQQMSAHNDQIVSICSQMSAHND